MVVAGKEEPIGIHGDHQAQALFCTVDVLNDAAYCKTFLTHDGPSKYTCSLDPSQFIS